VKPTYSVISKDENNLRKDILEENKKPIPKELLNCSNQKIIANQIAI